MPSLWRSNTGTLPLCRVCVVQSPTPVVVVIIICLVVYSGVRRAAARVLSVMGADGFDEMSSFMATTGDVAAGGTGSLPSRVGLANTTNDILDINKRKHFVDIFCKPLDEAAMTRALQVYTASPTVLSALDMEACDGVDDALVLTEEELELEKKNMREGLLSLQLFPFAVTSRVHRELYGKNYLGRRNRTNKRNVSCAL